MIAALLMIVVGFVAGGLGALAGVGGGILLVPAMNAGLGIDFRVAVATSLVAVIASSTGSAARYLQDDLPDIRVGMILEVATVFGAILGGLVVPSIPVDGLRVLFGTVALYLAGWQVWAMRYRPAERDTMSGARPEATNYPAGIAVSWIAGFVSATLGIGGGALKVPVMNMVMGLPFRVASATSNYMIGTTAAASALLYFRRGQIDLGITAPMVLGVLAGAYVGARTMPKVKVPALRAIFASILAVIAMQMFWRGLELGPFFGFEP